MKIFPDFSRGTLQLDEVNINYVIGGSGPPLLLLHGYPQTLFMWHKVAKKLAEHFTIVASDLRGYGDSSNPPTVPSHESYSKRASALDQVHLMKHLGFDKFYLVGHDRGGRVAHRLSLDFPETVSRLVVMDIAPTFAMYKNTDMEFARAYYHWFFLIQPFDLPERMIGYAPEIFLAQKLKQWGRNDEAITKEAFDEYVRCFTSETIHSSCEDYRASATIDLEHDQVDLDAGNKIHCPLLCLWGEQGFIGSKYDVAQEWRVWADQVEGHALPCGHYLPEEAPDEVLLAVLDFLS